MGILTGVSARKSKLPISASAANSRLSRHSLEGNDKRQF